MNLNQDLPKFEGIYRGKTCLVATMHEKEIAIRPSFETVLGMRIEVGKIDTDALGTFTGEIERTLSPKECAKTKCLRALSEHNKRIGIANEGSFGPHAGAPFCSVDYELFYFTDLELGYDLSVSKIFTETNFAAATFSQFDLLLHFAWDSLFPSHGLIVRPHLWGEDKICFKGIQSIDKLEAAFQESRALSKDGQVRVETDMRAHKNPTRMKHLKTLAEEMAHRLATPCPHCAIPGWGPVARLAGLPCAECGAETESVRALLWGCCVCEYKESVPSDKTAAEPTYCPICNP